VLIGAIAIGMFLLVGASLQQTVRDVARVAWHSPASHVKLTGWRAAVYRLRRFGIYPATFYVLTHWILPAIIMWWLFWWLAFGAANTLGLICKGTDGVEVENSATAAAAMDTAKVCNATGLKVTQGKTYRITLKVGKPWKDKDTDTNPNGFDRHQAPWIQSLGAPYRRLIWSNWFATILRVGGPGLEEHLLDLEQKDGTWTTTFEPRSSGEVFLYVNDAVIGLPWIYSLFYWNNQGMAEVKLEKISP